MNRKGIERATAAANTFILRAKILERYCRGTEQWQKRWSLSGNKETAALKRASLDLTRALAEMRRS